MTDMQRQQILAMKEKGLGYKAIALLLDLPVSTVKSFLRRKAAQDAVHPDILSRSNACEVPTRGTKIAVYTKCRHCGLPILQRIGAKRQIFCTAACRIAWWNAHRAPPNRRSVKAYTCACCGKTFYSGISTRKYCSRSCYLAKRYEGRLKHGVP